MKAAAVKEVNWSSQVISKGYGGESGVISVASLWPYAAAVATLVALW